MLFNAPRVPGRHEHREVRHRLALRLRLSRVAQEVRAHPERVHDVVLGRVVRERVRESARERAAERRARARGVLRVGGRVVGRRDRAEARSRSRVAGKRRSARGRRRRAARDATRAIADRGPRRRRAAAGVASDPRGRRGRRRHLARGESATARGGTWRRYLSERPGRLRCKLAVKKYCILRRRYLTGFFAYATASGAAQCLPRAHGFTLMNSSKS